MTASERSMVTALRAHGRHSDLVDVQVDGTVTFVLPADRAALLTIGQELGPDHMAALRQEADLVAGLRVAMRFLAARPRSLSETAARLARASIAPATAGLVLKRLEAVGLIDDAAFARWWVEDRCSHRPTARRGLTYELSARGVPRETIATALSGVKDEDLAVRAAIERAPRLRGLDRSQFERRLGGWLAQRGFEHEVVRVAVQKAWSALSAGR